MKVQAGQTLLVLSPLLSPERDVPTPVEQVQMAGAESHLGGRPGNAQGDMERSTADVAAAKITVERSKKLLPIVREVNAPVDDAVANLQSCRSNLAAARNRYDELSRLVKSLELQSSDAHATSLEIKAPLGGVIRTSTSHPSSQLLAVQPCSRLSILRRFGYAYPSLSI